MELTLQQMHSFRQGQVQFIYVLDCFFYDCDLERQRNKKLPSKTHVPLSHMHHPLLDFIAAARYRFKWSLPKSPEVLYWGGHVSFEDDKEPWAWWLSDTPWAETVLVIQFQTLECARTTLQDFALQVIRIRVLCCFYRQAGLECINTGLRI